MLAIKRQDVRIISKMTLTDLIDKTHRRIPTVAHPNDESHGNRGFVR